MPIYEIHHTHPLTQSEKARFAKSLTHLHSTTFLTPSLYVNVIFHFHPAPSNDNADPTAPVFFLAGEPTKHPSGPNRIVAMVRTGEARKKEDFDALALRIEQHWYEIVDGAAAGANGAATKPKLRGSEKMHMIAFYPMLAAIENGVVIPSVGKEDTWLKDNMPYFTRQADAGDEDFRKMIDEVNSREDLKKLLQ